MFPYYVSLRISWAWEKSCSSSVERRIRSWKIQIHATNTIVVCIHMGTSQNKEASWWGLSWGMIRGCDSGFDSGVWFGNIKLSFSIQHVYLHLHISVQNQFQAVGEVLLSQCLVRFGAHMLLAPRVLLSECAVWSGHAGAAAERCCRCCLRVMLGCCCQSSACALNNGLERACWWAGAGGWCCLRVLSG